MQFPGLMTATARLRLFNALSGTAAVWSACGPADSRWRNSPLSPIDAVGAVICKDLSSMSFSLDTIARHDLYPLALVEVRSSPSEVNFALATACALPKAIKNL